MASWNYLGPDPAANTDVVDLGYVTGTLEASNMTATQVDGLINADLQPYSKQTDVTTATTGLQTTAQVQAATAAYVPLTSVGQASGPIALDGAGKVPVNKVTVASTQRYPSPFYSPPSYLPTSSVSATTETLLFPCPISNPGYNYKLLCSGLIDVVTSVDAATAYPIVNVRVGSLTGPIIARGFGLGEYYQVSTGVSGFDGFQRSNATDLGPDWSMTYSNPGNGTLQVVGDLATWVKNGAAANKVLCRRVNATDGITVGDDQVCTTVWGSTQIQQYGYFAQSAENNIYLRLSANLQSYVRMSVTYNSYSLLYTTNGAANESFLINNVGINQNPYDVYSLGVVGRTWTLTQNGAVLRAYTETTPVTPKGPSNRGWGFGVASGNAVNLQTTPASVQSVAASDNSFLTNSSSANITPISFASQSVLTGAQTLYVTLQSADGVSSVTADSVDPGLFAMAVPA